MFYIPRLVFTAFALLFFFINCSTDKDKLVTESDTQETLQGSKQVSNIEISGTENAYTLAVTIESPDTGCDQYADWWEVIDLEGNLIYRRILDHSHVTEQPFTRTGGDIEISETKEVYVRLHMNNSGYATDAQKGSVNNGFQAIQLDAEFAKELELSEPLPSTCAF